MGYVPHNDDGKKIKTTRGRPPKPSLSADEWAMIEGKGHREASSIISQSRGSTVASISGLESARRRVSHEWIADQRRKKMNPSENSRHSPMRQPSRKHQVTSHSGPRMGYSQPFNNQEAFVNGPPTEGSEAFTPKVESERKEATA